MERAMVSLHNDRSVQLAPEPYVANITLHMMLSAIDEVMGPRGLRLVLAQAGQLHHLEVLPPADFDRVVRGQIIAAIWKVVLRWYGERGCRVFMAHAGAHYVTYLLATIPDIFITLREQIRPTLGKTEQLQQAVDLLARVTDQFTDIPVTTTKQNNTIIWTMPYTIDSWGQHASSPMCWSVRTSVWRLLCWIIDSQAITIAEVTCHACGAAGCSFQISLVDEVVD